MKIHRFFVEESIDGDAVNIVNPDAIHQMNKVLRFEVGDTLVLIDNKGLSRMANIEKISKEAVSCTLGEDVHSWKPKREIILCASIIKKDKFEWVIEKATELGVSRIVPVISEHTEKTNVDIRRANIILKEASEQSERLTIPTIDEPVSLEDALKNIEGKKVVLDIVADAGGVMSDAKVFFVGPEGGWGEKDKKLFQEYGVTLLSLGENVLRAETASVALLAKLM